MLNKVFSIITAILWTICAVCYICIVAIAATPYAITVMILDIIVASLSWICVYLAMTHKEETDESSTPELKK